MTHFFAQSLAAQIMWLWPDGSTSQWEPTDGKIFIEFDKSGNKVREWQWNSAHGQWYDITTPSSVNPFTGAKSKISFNGKEVDYGDNVSVKITPKEIKCECGSDAVGSPKHSRYCPKYDPKQ